MMIKRDEDGFIFLTNFNPGLIRELNRDEGLLRNFLNIALSRTL